MSKTTVITKASRLLDLANGFISSELKKNGINDLLPCHGDILYFVLKEPGIHVGKLASKTSRSKSTVSLMSDKLAALGYIEKKRSTADSRVCGLWPLPKCLEFQKIFESISAELSGRLFRGFAPEEKAQLEQLLARAVRNF